MRLALALLALLPSSGLALTPAQWHATRRQEILAKHPHVKALCGKSAVTLPLVAATNAAQLALCHWSTSLDAPLFVPAAVLAGGTLSLWQFALLHDVKHGNAELPEALTKDAALFWGAAPSSLFGYYLYLKHGHLQHHKDFGQFSLKQLFDSERVAFEDGDALFVAHRQKLRGDREGAGEGVGFFGKGEVGGLGVSISRTFYALGWRNGQAGAAVPAGINALTYATSMVFERAALCFNEKLVAVLGRNLFFPDKPAEFHRDCAEYARASLAIHAALLALWGPKALLWLFLAEVGWQLPVHPASAMFVSNHPSLDRPGGEGCQPTASIYLGAWFDWLCCFSNFHVEHHDFPDVPAFRLKELRDAAPEFYDERALAGARDGWWGTMRRTFSGRGFYACGDLSGLRP